MRFGGSGSPIGLHDLPPLPPFVVAKRKKRSRRSVSRRVEVGKGGGSASGQDGSGNGGGEWEEMVEGIRVEPSWVGDDDHHDHPNGGEDLNVVEEERMNEDNNGNVSSQGNDVDVDDDLSDERPSGLDVLSTDAHMEETHLPLKKRKTSMHIMFDTNINEKGQMEVEKNEDYKGEDEESKIKRQVERETYACGGGHPKGLKRVIPKGISINIGGTCVDEKRENGGIYASMKLKEKKLEFMGSEVGKGKLKNKKVRSGKKVYKVGGCGIVEKEVEGCGSGNGNGETSNCMVKIYPNEGGLSKEVERGGSEMRKNFVNGEGKEGALEKELEGISVGKYHGMEKKVAIEGELGTREAKKGKDQMAYNVNVVDDDDVKEDKDPDYEEEDDYDYDYDYDYDDDEEGEDIIDTDDDDDDDDDDAYGVVTSEKLLGFRREEKEDDKEMINVAEHKEIEKIRSADVEGKQTINGEEAQPTFAQNSSNNQGKIVEQEQEHGAKQGQQSLEQQHVKHQQHKPITTLGRNKNSHDEEKQESKDKVQVHMQQKEQTLGNPNKVGATKGRRGKDQMGSKPNYDSDFTEDLYTMVKRRQTLKVTKCNHQYRNGRRCNQTNPSHQSLCDDHKTNTRQRRVPDVGANLSPKRYKSINKIYEVAKVVVMDP